MSASMKDMTEAIEAFWDRTSKGETEPQRRQRAVLIESLRFKGGAIREITYQIPKGTLKRAWIEGQEVPIEVLINWLDGRLTVPCGWDPKALDPILDVEVEP